MVLADENTADTQQNQNQGEKRKQGVVSNSGGIGEVIPPQEPN